MLDITPSFTAACACFALCIMLLVLRNLTSRRSRYLPLPPGPKRLPILGNALDIPLSKQWLAFQRWAEEYGDIVYLNLLGQSVIVLNTTQATSDLLDKRSAIYSDRLKSTVVSLIGWDWNVALMGYGTRWRQIRRAFHEHFHGGVVRQYQPAQLSGARNFLTRLLVNPDSFVQDLRFDLGATILEVAYGIKAKDADDEYIVIGEKAVEGPTKALVLGALWVEFIPALRYLPPWWPGASYQRKALTWRQEATALKHEPFEKAMSDFRNGSGVWSLASKIMAREHETANSADKEELAKNVAAVTYGVQKRAQAELEAVVGPHRLPEFEDSKNLPYIHAIINECLRWQNVFTLGLPHRVMEEDEYKGYRIPKGSIVLGNIWAMSRNTQIFPKPDAFNPDRYFNDDATWNTDVLDPTAFAFGFGRRVCPGRHFAIASIYIYAASILHVFNISPKRDASGNPTEIKRDMVSGVVTYPTKFECDIIPRSADAEALIRV
ncbi:cytochrome P450 [Ganoderma sinense ZZ0214-1]|uniref:Cytochrome P450 n=1 Tax=Ganoderma sinense ZZ0214-1 TaxID=1077348 RepID=A0A2G8SE25_9APHY|nr:cytochrome P450 [Ganoderma sinense ZZ0214-1]